MYACVCGVVRVEYMMSVRGSMCVCACVVVCDGVLCDGLMCVCKNKSFAFSF